MHFQSLFYFFKKKSPRGGEKGGGGSRVRRNCVLFMGCLSFQSKSTVGTAVEGLSLPSRSLLLEHRWGTNPIIPPHPPSVLVYRRALPTYTHLKSVDIVHYARPPPPSLPPPSPSNPIPLGTKHLPHTPTHLEEAKAQTNRGTNIQTIAQSHHTTRGQALIIPKNNYAHSRGYLFN